jgi:hypothetical protein
MKKRWLVLVAIMLASCVSLPERYAALECQCQPGAEKVSRIFVQAQTGRWGCSAHSMGFYREIAWLSIKLPAEQQNSRRINVAELSVTDESTSPPAPLAFTSGHVELDFARMEVTLALNTATGPYWANGVYPARKR